MTVLFVVATIILFFTIEWISRKFKAKHASQTSPMQNVIAPYPVRTPEGIFFARTHTWLNLFPSGKLQIGIDDFVGRMIEKPKVVLLKNNGDHIEKGDPILLLQDSEKSLTIHSPIEAEIVGINDQIESRPELLKELLFSDGWAYTLKPKRFLDLRSLLLGPDSKTWMNMEFARFRDFISTLTGDARLIPVTLQDGGPPMTGAMRLMDEEAWQQFETEFLTEGSEKL